MRDRRLIYGLSAAAALLTLAVIVLIVLLVSGGDDDDEGRVAGEETEREETSTTEATSTSDEEEDDAAGNDDDDDDDSTPGEDDEDGEGTATATATSQPPASTPIDAVARFLENDDQEFVGPCEGTDIDEDSGKYCASERGMSGNQIAFAVGLTFSEFTDVFFVRPEGEGFIVDHIEPAPCGGQLPCPPPIGATVEIVTEGCVNARSQPTITASINQCVDDGTRAVISAGPTEADARTWVELQGLGWVSASFITCVEGCG